MYPDHVAFLTVTGIGHSVGGSALPNAPVVDDSSDRPPLRVQLAGLRLRIARLFGLNQRADSAPLQPAAVSR